MEWKQDLFYKNPTSHHIIKRLGMAGGAGTSVCGQPIGPSVQKALLLPGVGWMKGVQKNWSSRDGQVRS